MRKLKKVTRKKNKEILAKSVKLKAKSKKNIRIKKKKAKVSVVKPSNVTLPPAINVAVEIPRVKKTRRRKTTNPSRMYFTQDTEDAIILYNAEENLEVREKIFETRIYPAFSKLVENVFNTFKFSYFRTSPQDAQRECLTHLVANMHKFDPNRVSKLDPKKKSTAFAYFSIIAKHFLILLNNTTWKEINQNIEISEDHEENTVQLQQDDKYYAQKELSDFIKLIIEFWEKNANKIFTKQRDLNIANAVVELFRNSDRIDYYNKKALYLYIREMALCKTQQITKVINKMKQYHDNIQRNYLEYGYVNTDRTSLA